MKKTQRLISAVCSAALLLGMSFSGVFAMANVKVNFDDAEIFATNGDAQTGVISGFSYDVKAKQSIGIAAAPKADSKYDGSSMSTADAEDRAVNIAVASSGSSGAPFAQHSLGSWEGMDKVRVAFNAYVDSANNASYAPLQIGLRTKNNKESTLVGFRANGNLQYGGGSTYQKTYKKGQWYYFMCDIDIASKTYSVSVNGTEQYTDIPLQNSSLISFADSDENAVNGIRFYINNPQNSAGCSSYFDDVYVGAPYSASTETIVVNDLGLTDEEGTPVTALAQGEREGTVSASVTYSEKTEETPVDLYAALYDGSGVLKQAFACDDTIPASRTEGDFEYKINMHVKLSAQAGDSFKMFLWDKNLRTLSKCTEVEITDGRTYVYNNDFEDRSSAGISLVNSTNSSGAVQAAVGITGELEDEQGYAYKISCENILTSGAPFISLATAATPAGKVVNIEFKARMDRKNPIEVRLNNSANDILATFRPTGEIQLRGRAGTIAQKYPDNEWQSYRMELDFSDTEKTVYKLYCGGELLGSDETLTQKNVSNLRFTVSRNNNYPDAKSENYFDDIKIYY